jgi:putative ABC transport system substrate-binding protein
MKRETGHGHAGSRRRVGADDPRRSTRRRLLLALGAAALASPLTPHAQPQTKVWRVGFLGLRRPASLDTDFIGAFPQGMRELGYVEGKNLVIEWRFADGEAERLPGLAAELVQLKLDVLVAGAEISVRALQKATATIPIVIALGADLIGAGFVKSLAHPGGNITGNTLMGSEIVPKQLEMLLSMAPTLTRVAVLLSPANLNHAASLASVQAAAKTRRVTILPVEARRSEEIEKAFALMRRDKAGAVIVLADGIFNGKARQIAELAAKSRLLSVARIREYVDAGCLMSYGPSFSDSFRRVATYVDKIFKGAKPGDLPVEQPTKFELFINGKTAKALGLKIPQSLLISADKVIE